MQQEHIIIIGLIVAIFVLIWWTRKEHETDTLYVNGTPIRVDKSSYGVYTSGASLRDQVQFTSTDQGL
jgi:hypothetical protein